jgi:hypothetical protein
MLVEALRARNQSSSLHPLVEQVAAGTQTIDLLFRSLLDLSKLEGARCCRRWSHANSIR